MPTPEITNSKTMQDPKVISPIDVITEVADNVTDEKQDELESAGKEQPVQENKTNKHTTPQQTVKLANPSVATIIQPVTDTTTNKQVQVSQSVRFIREHIKKYLEYPRTPGVKSVKFNIMLFQNIVIYAMENPTNEVLDEVYSFFRTNRKSVLEPEQALQGIHTLTLEKREKLQHVYMLFYTIAIDGKTPPLDLEYAARVLKSNELISYIESKIRK